MQTIQKYAILALDSLQPKLTLAAVLLKEDDGQRSGLAKLLGTVIVLLQDLTFRAKLKEDLKNSAETAKLRQLFANVLELSLIHI